MAGDRAYKSFVPGVSNGRRRRSRRFFLLALLLGAFLAIAAGAILYTLNSQGRI